MSVRDRVRDRVHRVVDAVLGDVPAPTLDVHPADLRGASGANRRHRMGTGTLVNQVTLIGTEQDTAFWDCLALKRPLTDEERLSAGRDAVAAAGLRVLPEEAIAADWEPRFTDERVEDQADALAKTVKDYERKLDTIKHYTEAAVAGRQFAHALVWIGVDDGRPPEEPVDFANIKTIHWLHVVDRRDYRLGPIAPSEDAAHFGNFEHVEIQRLNGVLPDGLRHPSFFGVDGGPSSTLTLGQPTIIHRDRVLMFPGPDWLPVLDTARDYLANWWKVNKGIVTGVEESALSVWKVKDWIAKMFGGDDMEAIERMRLASRMKSIIGAIVLDKKEEDFEFVQRSLAGLGPAAEPIMIALAAAFRLPVTKLFGVRPAAFASEDAGRLDFEVDKDRWRKANLTLAVLRLTAMILAAADGAGLGFTDVELELEWGDLTPPDETQVSENNERDLGEMREAVIAQILLASEVAPKYAEKYNIDLDEEARATGDGDRPDLAVGTAQALTDLVTTFYGDDIPPPVARSLAGLFSASITPAEQAVLFPDTLDGQTGVPALAEAPPTTDPAATAEAVSQIKARRTNAVTNAAKAGTIDPAVAGADTIKTYQLVVPEPEPEPEPTEEEVMAAEDQPPEGEDAVTPREAGEMLRVPTRTITLAIERGDLRAFNVLGKRKLSLAAVRAFLLQGNQLASEATTDGIVSGLDRWLCDYLDVIEQRGGKWVVLSKAGEILGEHELRSEALEQLRAVEASKEDDAYKDPDDEDKHE